MFCEQMEQDIVASQDRKPSDSSRMALSLLCIALAWVVVASFIVAAVGPDVVADAIRWALS